MQIPYILRSFLCMRAAAIGPAHKNIEVRKTESKTNFTWNNLLSCVWGCACSPNHSSENSKANWVYKLFQGRVHLLDKYSLYINKTYPVLKSVEIIMMDVLIIIAKKWSVHAWNF